MMNLRRILALCLALMMGLLACPARASGMEEHLLLDARMAGSCTVLTGEIELLTIFVDLDGDEWDAQDMLEMNAQISQAVAALEKDAASYGAQLSIRVTPGFGWTDTTITINQDDSWAAEILAGMDDMPGLDEGHKYINRPVLFLINDGGRSFASTYASDDMAEHAAVFRGEDAGTIRHELLHLFGARDFYIHDAIEAAAKTYFPDSVMLSADEDKAVDSLTAYLVGWTSTPDAQAQRFLTDTRRITQDDINTAHEQNILSGYQTVESDGISYAGLMEDGLYHGLGTITWADGSTYTGDWLWGTRTGKGTYTWTNGCTYSGDYFNNERTGNGVFTWETGESYVGGFSNNLFDGKGIFTGIDGSSYAGDYVADQRNGKGILVWADKSSYAGDFVNGERTGKGVCTWPDGSIYMGDFAKGIRNGKGVYLWPSGSSYAGDYVNGECHGKGTYTWPDGSSYTGDFVKGVRTGKGVYRWADGSTYSGDFVDGAMTGKGTLSWPDGSVYAGDFVNGAMSGKGTYVSASGDVMSGYWENSSFIR